MYLVNGYPDFRAEKDEMEEVIVAGNLPYFTGLWDVNEMSIPDVNPADHIVLDVNQVDEPGGVWDGLILDKTHGISGGGVWRRMG